jgi:hypothetical protein
MAKHKNLQYQNNFNEISMGQNGLRVLASGSTSIQGEVFAVIEADIDSVITCTMLSSDDREIGDSNLTDFTLKEGRYKYGRFTNIIVTSGQVTAYKG